MKHFSQWKKNEGVNPTDIDSAGEDQKLDNIGVPFDSKAFDDIASKTSKQEDSDREYQKKIFDLMYKNKEKTDPNDIDPTKPAKIEEKGGTVDKVVKKYLEKQIKNQDASAKEQSLKRQDIPVKVTSTYFRQSQQPPRDDARTNDGNADRHGETIEKERKRGGK